MQHIQSTAAGAAVHHNPIQWLAWVLFAGFALTAGAIAQPMFSIDWRGPPIGAPDACFGVPITEGDLLTTPLWGPPRPGPLPTPCIAISGGFGPPAPGLALPLHPPAIGHPPGVPGMVEVDAISFGTDYAPKQGANHKYVKWYFSVDEFAVGLPNAPAPPNVFSAGIAGWNEAAGDVFVAIGLTGALPPCARQPNMGNTESIDGNGLAPYGGPGIGLIEPDPPWPGPVAPGSNLDAVDVDTLIMPGQPAVVYYSLDAAFMDPLRGVPNSGSAATIAPGIVGGDVLVGHLPGGPPVPYARAVQLGLDLFGPGTDDLNALALWENGTGAFERNVGPFSWVGGATDALFFSVRRGSALVVNRVPDSRCGLPIEEGDILVPPFIQGLPPAIWIPAESLGLATVRSGTAAGFGDDLDALDVLCRILGDLDQDGDVDLADLSTLLAAYGRGPAGDLNGDGVTDLSDLAIMLSQYGLFC